MKKYLGYLLIIIGIVFVFIAIARSTSLITNVLGILNVFDSDISEGERGYIVGGFLWWIIHFLVMFFAFKYGIKLTKKKKTKTD